MNEAHLAWNCRFYDVSGDSAFAPANYSFGIENQSRHAIEAGISDALSSAPIFTERQIYLVNEAGQHHLGRFDKATEHGNQSWVFNYVTPPENVTNMPSLKNVVNVWEYHSLSLQQIFDQVSAFIASTLNS